jgi:uncharacterized protein YdeI (YjbR/CyaY-like superfamily)
VKIHFFTPKTFRAWLTKNHATAAEVWVGLHKVHTKKESISWKQAIDAVLCFGWIDGVRYPIDADSYRIRFTPRRKGSRWSAVNLKRAAELEAQRLMTPAGRKAVAEGQHRKTDYAFEQKKPVKLSAPYAKRLKANVKAHAYFTAKAPWYQRTASFWVMSAKQEETRERRFAHLLEQSAKGEHISQLKPR